MKSIEFDNIVEKISDAVVRASCCFSESHLSVLTQAIAKENNIHARWVLERIVENAYIAEKEKRPLCDDTGVPHVFIEMGDDRMLNTDMFDAINEGIAEGLRRLPGRPMAVLGDNIQRIEQSEGLDMDPGALVSAPIFIKRIKDNVIRLHVLMQGGGPEIRGKTYRVFHQHNMDVVFEDILRWAKESASLLGCTPCAPAIGVGRSHYEANTLMLEAMVHGDYAMQSELESNFTKALNECKVGPLGLGGNNTALASFIKIGPQRASGVRIVCMRLCCIVEPRIASFEI